MRRGRRSRLHAAVLRFDGSELSKERKEREGRASNGCMEIGLMDDDGAEMRRDDGKEEDEAR